MKKNTSKSANIGAIERYTNKPWGDWVKIIEAFGGTDLAHKEIVTRLKSHCDSSWWRQEIVVAYEQYTGRRKPGQVADGTFGTSVSKTFATTPEKLMKAWKKFFEGDEKLRKNVNGKLRESTTPKYLNWRITCKDDTQLHISVSERDKDKSSIVITQTNMKHEKDIIQAKKRWKETLNQLLV